MTDKKIPTGRLTSTEPRFQDIPMRTELGRSLRKVFEAPPGTYFLAMDYSAIELRLYKLLSAEERKALWCCDIYPRRDVHIRGISGGYVKSTGPVIKSKEEKPK